MVALTRIATASGALIASCLAPAPASAQQLEWQVAGHIGYERFGSALANWRDHDGDGVADLLVGVDQAGGSFEPAEARIVSGVDLATLLEVSSGSETHEGFGRQVADVGDIDGDGIADFAVGAPIGEYVRVFSGVDGSQLREWTSPHAVSALGSSLAALGDVDGDGHADVAIGAPDETSGGLRVGAVRVVSGRTGALLLRLVGSTKLGGFGGFGGSGRVAALPDLDGDLLADLALIDRVTSGGAERGHLRLASSATGLDLLTLTFDFADYVDHEPVAIAHVGDLDRDGTPDVMVGALPVDPALDPGRVFVFSGATGSELVRADLGTDPSYVVVAAPGDVDGDALVDLAVAVADVRGGTRVAAVSVYRGANGARLRRITAVDGVGFGRALAAGADFDGDGVGDVAIGDPDRHASDLHVGAVDLHSLPSGAALAGKLGEFGVERFSGDLANVGDVNGDGLGDAVAVSSGSGVGDARALVVSGRNGGILARHPVPDQPWGPVIALPDLDGDGRQDFAVSAPSSTGSGTVQVLSTGSGAILATIVGSGVGELFGRAVAAAVQPGGGVHLAIGAPWSSLAATSGGLVEVYDVASGALLMNHSGKARNELLGWAIAPLDEPRR